MSVQESARVRFAGPNSTNQGKRRFSLPGLDSSGIRVKRSSILNYDLDQLPRDSMEEKRQLVDNLNSPPLPRLSKRWIRLLGSALGVIFIMLAGLSLLVTPNTEGGDSSRMRQLLAKYGLLELPTTCENPWIEYGRMVVDQRIPENNRWVPYDLSCTTPELMASLRAVHVNTTAPPLVLPLANLFPSVDNSLPFPWLHNRTVLLFGDHVERQHALDFCNLAGGSHLIINSNHPISPPPFVNGIDEKFLRSDKPDHDDSRPSVCYLEKYNFMIVTVFHYGLANRVEFERESLLVDPHFYPPVGMTDRLSHIVLPLLKSLGRPHPDLLEFSSGFWDLRHFSTLDVLKHQDPTSELSIERFGWYSDRLTKSIATLGTIFPGTPLLWRALHHTPKSSITPFTRLAALDQLGRKVVRDFNKSSKRIPFVVGPSKSGESRRQKPTKERESTHASFLNRVNNRINNAGPKSQILQQIGVDSLVGKIRVDEWGALMLGQEHGRDDVDTALLPGGFIWADILLSELRRVTTRHANYVEVQPRVGGV